MPQKSAKTSPSDLVLQMLSLESLVKQYLEYQLRGCGRMTHLGDPANYGRLDILSKYSLWSPVQRYKAISAKISLMLQKSTKSSPSDLVL